jgi:hypothetical protein
MPKEYYMAREDEPSLPTKLLMLASSINILNASFTIMAAPTTLLLFYELRNEGLTHIPGTHCLIFLAFTQSPRSN